MVIYEHADKDVDLANLNEEVGALGIPGFLGTGRISRRQNAEGVWEASARHVIIKFEEEITATQQASVQSAVTEHQA